MEFEELGYFAKLSMAGTSYQVKPVLANGVTILVGQHDNGEEFYYIRVEDKDVLEQFVNIMTVVGG